MLPMQEGVSCSSPARQMSALLRRPPKDSHREIWASYGLVLAAVVRLNKSISFSCIEPLHNTCRHVSHSFGKTIVAVERRKDHWASKTHPPAKRNRGWKRRFDEPIPLPRGRQLVTLEDAGNYITKLPKAEHEAEEWQAAMEALILVATSGGPTMFARIGAMRALNRHVEREFNPDRKAHHWGRRKLKRDE